MNCLIVVIFPIVLGCILGIIKVVLQMQNLFLKGDLWDVYRTRYPRSEK